MQWQSKSALMSYYLSFFLNLRALDVRQLFLKTVNFVCQGQINIICTSLYLCLATHQMLDCQYIHAADYARASILSGNRLYEGKGEIDRRDL